MPVWMAKGRMPRMNIDRVTSGIESWLLPTVKLLDRLTWVILFVLMMLTVANVVLRLPVFNTSIIGAKELTELMMILIVFCSLAQCQADDGHIQVDLVMRRMQPRTQAIVDCFTQLACALLFVLMTWALYLQAVDIKAWGEVTMDLRLPIYPFVFAASIGSAFLAAVLFLKTLLALGKVSKS